MANSMAKLQMPRRCCTRFGRAPRSSQHPRHSKPRPHDDSPCQQFERRGAHKGAESVAHKGAESVVLKLEQPAFSRERLADQYRVAEVSGYEMRDRGHFSDSRISRLAYPRWTAAFNS